MKKNNAFASILTVMLLAPLLICEIYLLIRMGYNQVTTGALSEDGQLQVYMMFFIVVSVAIALMLLMISLWSLLQIKKIRPFYLGIIVQGIHILIIIIFILLTR